MLTTDEIRALNEARDILDRLQADCAKHRSDKPEHYTKPDGWDYGRITATAYKAEWEVFQVLNELNSTRAQLIPDLLMHNREENPTRAPGRADSISVESEDDGFWLHVAAEIGLYTFPVGDGHELLEAVKPIADHWAEGRRLAAEHQQIDDGAYALDDPKHPTYHERMSDLADRRKP